MSINYAILGMLSFQSMTGYDLKKIIQNTSFLPWSGNNNQIYKALLELADKDFVSSETHHQEGAPSKKVYRITETGLAELKKWSQSQSEIFEIKKSFLIQFAFTNLLTDEELKELLLSYERDIEGQVLIERNRSASIFHQGRNSRETAVWKLINNNIILSYETELAWIHQAKNTLFGSADTGTGTSAPVSPTAKEEQTMNYQIIEKSNQRYIWLPPEGAAIETEQDANRLFTICIENSISLLLIDGSRLSDHFLQLRTGIAGIAMQKFVQYHIKAAAVLDETGTKGRFREFLTESNRGNVFRSFQTTADAETWLLDNPQ